ncbi:MAG: acyl-CoA thioesterase [Spirochaetes bacterium GWF1_31_7]|nr:MAG: acyl-CoA thioesterase [Spirochaetes bacterium GWE1_32_154]OHD46532.1 MAG: acyl-CoA thioesterase [Spirochaetes bacterium GWF1_31_7]OHD49341.1 MAG: acyl-CoA thioesterase [Spirochaetes bacterium GWE2_31_10]OHD79440.1 MAG: acyl-CoA thioesterase [Spirochaetes bacterium RIFOXYB1_FULL_32_8]HBD93079.1 acyl-CoA thioesterase [Spirochaetia bacterium]
METFILVRPEHLNHYGYLFGGMMLKWVDEFAWIAASKEFTGAKLVTIAMNNILFKERVVNGSILRFHINLAKKGTTSVEYAVDVYADEPDNQIEKKVFSTSITFVNINEHGEKLKII